MQINKLEEFVKVNLPKALKNTTELELGDRKTYIGSSDIGSCLRKAYLDKTTDIEYDISTLIRFQRGHVAEGIVEAMLDGLDVTRQREAKIIHNGFDLKAHIDFSLENKNEILVIEAKSVATSVDEAYKSWILQVQYQLHLLKETANKEVRGYIIAINLNSGWFKAFEVKYNEAIAKLALENAYTLVSSLQNNEEPQAKEELYCSVCLHKTTCPLILKASSALDCGSDIFKIAKDFVELNSKKKQLEKELEEKKSLIEEYMRNANLNKISLDNSLISLSKDTQSTSFDTKLLKEKEPELYETLFAKYSKTVARKGYISVK